MIRAILPALFFAPSLAAASPVQWSWGGYVTDPGAHNLAPQGWPPPAQWLGESRQCTGTLAVSYRGEDGGASWLLGSAVLFGDPSAGGHTRILHPATNAWQLPLWSHQAPGARVQVGVGALGVQIRVEGIGAWSATFIGDCAWL
jgi:hypothetical protein